MVFALSGTNGKQLLQDESFDFTYKDSASTLHSTQVLGKQEVLFASLAFTNLPPVAPLHP